MAIKTFKKLTKQEFEELKNEYYYITEAIELYDSGNHPEYGYNEEWLNYQLDSVHMDLCDAASDIAQYFIYKIDNGEKLEKTGEDLDNIRYLNFLYDMAASCKVLGEAPEAFELNNCYGNGVVDSIGADFYVFYCKRREESYFGYSEFFQLLEEYGLIID